MKHQFFDFDPNSKIFVARPIGRKIEALMKRGSMISELEECYAIIREECPHYSHQDNSNARKMMTGRKIKGVKRLLPLTAYLRILDKLGIASGKYIQGKQLDMFTKSVNKNAD